MVVLVQINCTGRVCQARFHSAIFTMDDEIYCKTDVPRVLNPWLMQRRTIFSDDVCSDQSAARAILRQPISARMFDVTKPDIPVVKLVSRGLWADFHLTSSSKTMGYTNIPVGDPVLCVGLRVWREYLAADKGVTLIVTLYFQLLTRNVWFSKFPLQRIQRIVWPVKEYVFSRGL